MTLNLEPRNGVHSISDIQEKILQGTAHVNLLREDNRGIEDYGQLFNKIRRIPGITQASATIYAPVLLTISDLDLSNRGAFVDWHAFAGAFRVRGGWFATDNTLDAVGQPGAVGTLSDAPALQAAIEQEEVELEDDVDKYDLYPVVSFGVSWRF